MSKMKEKRGITLMALVVTIIVLLILAGVTISTLTGENGIIGKANEAKDNTNLSQLKEQMMIDIIKVQTENNGKVTKGDLETIAQKYGGTLSEDKKTIIIGDKEIAVSDIYDGTLEKEPMVGEITAANYGDYVNYNVEIGLDNTATEHKTDWRIFYNDGANIFLIASDYVQNTKIPTLTELGMTTYGAYSVYWTNSTELPFKHAGMADVSEGTATRYQLGWRAANSADTDNNAKATAALLDTSKWSYFAGGISGAEAVGGPTLEMYTNSWNEKGYTKLHCDNSNDKGYYVGTTPGATTTSVSMLLWDLAGCENTLYYPHRETVDGSKCQGFRLSTPSARNSDYMVIVRYDGYIGNNENYSSQIFGVRPVVYLPSEIAGEKDANGIWQIQ